jgi:hypothetical protein
MPACAFGHAAHVPGLRAANHGCGSRDKSVEIRPMRKATPVFSQPSASSVGGSTKSASRLGRGRRGSRTPAPPDPRSSPGPPPRPRRQRKRGRLSRRGGAVDPRSAICLGRSPCLPWSSTTRSRPRRRCFRNGLLSTGTSLRRRPAFASPRVCAALSVTALLSAGAPRLPRRHGERKIDMT